MDPQYTLVHTLCAVAALVATALMSAPAGHPQSRPWLAGSLFVLGLAELYVTAVCIGFTLRWPALHGFALLWLVLPALLWRHFAEQPRTPRHNRFARWHHA